MNSVFSHEAMSERSEQMAMKQRRRFKQDYRYDQRGDCKSLSA